MTENLYIDNAARKRIVTFWIPVCLGFLHAWNTMLVFAICFGKKAEMDGETIRAMFSSSVTGVGFLILLLISDKALEYIIARLTGASVTSGGQTVKTTTTQETTVIPVANSTPVAQDVNIEAQGDVNVSKSS